MTLPSIADLVRDLRIQRTAARDYDHDARELRKCANWSERAGDFDCARLFRDYARIAERAARSEGRS